MLQYFWQVSDWSKAWHWANCVIARRQLSSQVAVNRSHTCGLWPYGCRHYHQGAACRWRRGIPKSLKVWSLGSILIAQEVALFLWQPTASVSINWPQGRKWKTFQRPKREQNYYAACVPASCSTSLTLLLAQSCGIWTSNLVNWLHTCYFAKLEKCYFSIWSWNWNRLCQELSMILGWDLSYLDSFSPGVSAYLSYWSASPSSQNTAAGWKKTAHIPLWLALKWTLTKSPQLIHIRGINGHLFCTNGEFCCLFQFKSKISSPFSALPNPRAGELANNLLLIVKTLQHLRTAPVPSSAFVSVCQSAILLRSMITVWEAMGISLYQNTTLLGKVLAQK